MIAGCAWVGEAAVLHGWAAVVHFRAVGIVRTLAPVLSPQRLGARIMAAREQAKLTREQVADALELGRTILLAIEEGEQCPSNAELLRLAEVIGVDIHLLLCERSVVAELRAIKYRDGGSSSLEKSDMDERHVARAVLAYELALLSEGELADCLEVDIVTARAIHQGCPTVGFDDVRLILELVTAVAPTQ